MIVFQQYLDFVLHLNRHLGHLIADLGPWVYLVLFLVILLETGFFLTPFLPGESLLFVLGTLGATNVINVHWLFVILSVAAFMGGFINYALGWTIGTRFFSDQSVYKRYLDKTHDFYEKHGTLTIVTARLVPIIRTYAPFVAGVVRMNFTLFSFYNVIGGIAWISLFLYSSYWFGHIPLVQQNFSLVILGIVVISVVPVIMELARQFYRNKYQEKS